MKVKKTITQYVALLGATFMLAAGLTVSIAPKASASCLPHLCAIYFQECPAGSDCPGEQCFQMFDHSTGGTGNTCCGDMTVWNCFE